MINELKLTFPYQLDRVKEGILKQESKLKEVAGIYADAVESGGLVHIYANGHSRIAVEELVIRMGALTGFHPLLSAGLTTFTDVIGMNGIRVNQHVEKYEGMAAAMLDEVCFGSKDVLVVVTATGTTTAAVDMAIEFVKRYPRLSIVGIASEAQSTQALPKHSSGKNLYEVVVNADRGIFIDNCMPIGDLTIDFNGEHGHYQVCPLSSVGAITIVQSLNELTIKELDRRGIVHHVLRNMHLDKTEDNYNEWIKDQGQRYALSIYNPDAVQPVR